MKTLILLMILLSSCEAHNPDDEIDPSFFNGKTVAKSYMISFDDMVIRFTDCTGVVIHSQKYGPEIKPLNAERSNP